MSSHKTAQVGRVLSGALRVWGVSASVESDPERPDGLVLRTPAGVRMQIVPAAPHGWLVLRDARPLEKHAGLPGLLRALREELAPGAATGRLVIGSQMLR
ncbi:MAG TPA: hypothetical protein VGX52_05700 [Burkholderiales bacterium]|nr:hypothetical protein [Burkholderiales bacterium]